MSSPVQSPGRSPVGKDHRSPKDSSCYCLSSRQALLSAPRKVVARREEVWMVVYNQFFQFSCGQD